MKTYDSVYHECQHCAGVMFLNVNALHVEARDEPETREAWLLDDYEMQWECPYCGVEDSIDTSDL